MCVHNSINIDKKKIINLTQNAESDIDILNTCPYMERENIRDISPEIVDLKIMHLNVYSILVKQTKLKELLHGLYTENPDLDANPIMWNILEYINTKFGWFPWIQFNMQKKNKKRNGGVPVLIKDHFNYAIWEDISIFEGEFESVL